MRSEVQRISRCSSSYANFINGRSEFIQRLVRYFVPGAHIEHLLKYDPFRANMFREPDHVRIKKQQDPASWMVLPFHPKVPSHIVSKAVSESVAVPWWQSYCAYNWRDPKAASVRISWKLTGKRVLQWLPKRQKPNTVHQWLEDG